MTTKDTLAHDWQAFRGKVRDRWYSLSEADVDDINGDYEGLLTALQAKYFYSRKTAESDVSHFLNESAPTI